MKSLNQADEAFLWLENRQQPTQIGGLQLFTLPDNAGDEFLNELMLFLYSFDQPSGAFGRCLKKKWGRHYWENDQHFEIKYHVRRQQLPPSSSVDALLEWVSIEHSHLMDRSRPLWEYHVIDGLGHRQFAIYIKVHHSMVDGVSAMRLLSNSLSSDASVTDVAPPWMGHNITCKKTLDMPSIFSRVLSLKQAVSIQIPAIFSSVIAASRLYRKQPPGEHGLVGVRQAPKSQLNQSITSSRVFAMHTLPLQRLKIISHQCSVTLNDVLLYVCATAIRHHLIGQGALPDKPLISMVPMSTREEGNHELGNQVVTILANLGTDILDPLKRLQVIHQSVLAAKNTFANMSSDETASYGALLMLPFSLNVLTKGKLGLQTYNVMISNIPGSKQTLFLNGAALDGLFPISIPLNQYALNVSILSYADQLQFGFIACRKVLPFIEQLTVFLEQSVQELEDAMGQKKITKKTEHSALS